GVHEQRAGAQGTARGDRSPGGLRAQRTEDLGMLGEAAFGLLRKDEPPIRNDVVLALRAFDRLRVVPLIRQLSRETRGSFVVAVSDGAVVDLDGHPRIVTTP